VAGTDLAGARECFAFATEHGSGCTRESATVALAHILAAAGDRQGVTEAFRSVGAERFRAGGVEVSDVELRRFASWVAGLVLRPRLRRLVRRYRATTYRVLRIRRRLFPGGLRARR
jgi:hypothetical protein